MKKIYDEGEEIFCREKLLLIDLQSWYFRICITFFNWILFIFIEHIHFSRAGFYSIYFLLIDNMIFYRSPKPFFNIHNILT